jgi:hypothetical protein
MEPLVPPDEEGSIKLSFLLVSRTRKSSCLGQVASFMNQTFNQCEMVLHGYREEGKLFKSNFKKERK